MFGGVGGILHSMTATNATTEPQNWREYRRLRVWEMHQQGHRQQGIADALGLTQGAVSQIIARAEAGGVEALRYHKPQGAKPRLSAAQKTDLLEQLRQGATAHGFQGDVWTCEPERQTGVRTGGRTRRAKAASVWATSCRQRARPMRSFCLSKMNRPE